MSVGELSVGELSVGELSVDEMSVGELSGYPLTHMQCNVSLCNGDSGRPAVRPSVRLSVRSSVRPSVRQSVRPAAGVVKNFNVGYISLNIGPIRGRILIFGIHIDHMDLYPPTSIKDTCIIQIKLHPTGKSRSRIIR